MYLLLIKRDGFNAVMRIASSFYLVLPHELRAFGKGI